MTNGYSRLALIGGLVAILAFATAAVLFVSGTDSLQRLALLFGLFGIAVPSVIGLLKSDESAQSTNATSNIATALNGAFDARVRNAVRVVTSDPKAPIESVDMPLDASSNIDTGTPAATAPVTPPSK